MWWLEELGGRADDPDASWNGFLDRLPEPGSEGLSLMRGFLRALLDCCEQDGGIRWVRRTAGGAGAAVGMRGNRSGGNGRETGSAVGA